MAVDGTVSVGMKLVHSQSYNLGPRTAQILQSLNLVYENGTGANQVDLIYSATRTLTASATENLDLAGTLTDAFGATLTFAKIKLLYFKAADANTNDIVIGNVTNGITSPFGAATHSLTIRPGGVFLWGCRGAGFSITAGTADLVKVANGAGSTSVTYDVVVAGTSV